MLEELHVRQPAQATAAPHWVASFHYSSLEPTLSLLAAMFVYLASTSLLIWVWITHVPCTCAMQLILPTSSTPTYPAVVAVRLVGHTHVADAVVNSQIDYCNTTAIAGVPRTVMDKLQRVLNAAARVVTGTRKCDHGLHGQILHFTGSMIPTRYSSSWWCLNGRAPPYLLDHCVQVADICVLPTVNWLQCHASGSTLTITVGSFQLLAPRSRTLSWISPNPYHPEVSADCLRRLVKTYLFARY